MSGWYVQEWHLCGWSQKGCGIVWPGFFDDTGHDSGHCPGSGCSCNPFSGPNGSCALGNLASYAINVADAQSAIAGIRFAQQKKIRLTIKNTGHDYLGRSTGYGSLALWSHNLKSMSFINYTSAHYNGPAAKVGAGVEVSDVYQAAQSHGLRVVGGGCPSVGLGGGWLTGGGHGPLTSAYGLGADEVLEYEVVTAKG
jgi:hypothetical protein